MPLHAAYSSDCRRALKSESTCSSSGVLTRYCYSPIVEDNCVGKRQRLIYRRHYNSRNCLIRATHTYIHTSDWRAGSSFFDPSHAIPETNGSQRITNYFITSPSFAKISILTNFLISPSFINLFELSRISWDFLICEKWETLIWKITVI